ncbi:site-specific DNA-methyltransferase [Enterobacter hormaechei]|uniref:site-specific DNA-methyltransferase n=1 Tax=Enterobacter hormaechei TaxID=158836 RepID=UPI0011DD9C85|nr:site-specific DNA-methyltransferase [Enterobacter hormaechei]TXU04713.1 site-specific DNA-methyltransferase [Enterobacter hormaechei]
MSEIKKITGNCTEAKSLDITTQNIEKLKQIFPEVFSEGKIDFEVLKSVLGEKIDDSEERYNFTWNGKMKARQIAQTPSVGTLLPCKDDSVNWETSEDLLIEGDNLEILKLLQKSYHKKVKMIFIDPPYNTGNDFVYSDDFSDSIEHYLKITKQVDGLGYMLSTNKDESGRFHSNWLNMMYPRLKLARNLLTDDGAIFIAIDDNEVVNLRKICDEIFGEANFIANIIWQHSVQPKGYSGIFSVHHNHILCYQKSEDFELRSLERTDEDNKNYSNPDNDPRGAWRKGDVRNALYRPNLKYIINTPSGNKILPPENGWRWSKETLNEKIKTGEIYFNEDETKIIRKIYLDTLVGRTPETIWFGKDVGTTREATKEVKELFDGEAPFDTPKPMKLIKKLSELVGLGKGDICLDFFAGSGSTACSFYTYNNFAKTISIQLPEPIDVSKPHGKIANKLGMNTIFDITKERLKRTARLNKKGFKVFKLESTNILSWDANFENLEKILQQATKSIKSGRTSEDVLYEIFLKYGYELTTPVETKTVNGKTVFVVGAGALIVCLDDKITTETVEGIAKLKAELDPETTQVVFKDEGFADDRVKTNAILILKQTGIDDVKSI